MPHPNAGATVVGARRPLIALNVMLPSRGVAQISMDLLDYRRTPPLTVMERLDAETARRGLRIAHYELVGCAPADAFDEPARARIPDRRPSQRLDPTWYS